MRGRRVASIAVVGATLAMCCAAGQGAAGAATVTFGTNLTQPLASWTPVLTNAFDGSGNFNLSTNLNTAAPQKFFILGQ